MNDLDRIKNFQLATNGIARLCEDGMISLNTMTKAAKDVALTLCVDTDIVLNEIQRLLDVWEKWEEEDVLS